MKSKLIAALIVSALCSSAAFADIKEQSGTHHTIKHHGFAPSWGYNVIKNREVRSKNGEQLGKLTDAVVDLESGRLVYAEISGDGGNYAVPATLFSGSGRGHFTVNTDKSHLTSAPKVSGNNDFGNMEYVNKVYQHFNETPWWGTPTGRENTGKFGNVHRASNLAGMAVQDSSGQNLGTVKEVVIDFENGRVPFVLLNAPDIAKSGQLIPVPPMALTHSSGQNHLTTGVDRNKLKSAPQVEAGKGRLNDAQFAANVYEFYGKQPYWNQ